jgi:methylated-DNA-[protein]-cysteine S-methyltransferase
MSASPVVYAVLEAPWGPVHVAATARGVAAIELMAPTDGFVARLERRFRAPVVAAGDRPDGEPAVRLVRRVQAVLEAYLAGRTIDDDLPLDLGDRPAWDRAVLSAVRSVGYGEVTSYGRIARRIGRSRAGQAVGGAVGRNPIALLIPCHRVIAADGSLGGYGGAWWGTREQMLEVKRYLLDREGVRLPVAWPLDPDALTAPAAAEEGARDEEPVSSGTPR